MSLSKAGQGTLTQRRRHPSWVPPSHFETIAEGISLGEPLLDLAANATQNPQYDGDNENDQADVEQEFHRFHQDSKQQKNDGDNGQDDDQ